MNSTSARVRSTAIPFALAAALAMASAARVVAATVELPAGSANALAAAVTKAGSGGTVILKAGMHKESGPVAINIPVTITGEPGAVLQSVTSPGYPNGFPITITGALHFKGAPGATVQGVWFQPPPGAVGSCAVLFEDSPGARALNNRITEVQYGIFVQRSDDAVIRGNTISPSTNWDLDPADPAYLGDSAGIFVAIAARAQVTGNQISGGLAGISASGPAGDISGNALTGNLFGQLLCSVPDQLYRIAGVWQTAPPPSGWYIHENIIRNNLWGVMATDRANSNVLSNNDAAGNLVYDMEFTGDTKRFAPVIPLAPAAYDNMILLGSFPGLVIKDCGRNNQIRGAAKRVDPSVDACY